jgi:gamma-glutamylcyclotransferase (GGCT)/AIG2-like uncharacterized protein YtfP
MKNIFYLICLPLSIQAIPCHPPINPSKPQYMIGYGSLLETQSRTRTAITGSGQPIHLNHYQRGWFARSEGIGAGTTYLGVRPKKNASFNGAIYAVKQSILQKFDQREINSCRVEVSKDWIHPFINALPEGQFWIYVTKPKDIAKPNKRYPIVQSYVDIFLSGCLELEASKKNFATQCILTTQDWSTHWVNDRIYPRRPHIFQPNATSIDTLLAKNIPDYFNQIKLSE